MNRRSILKLFASAPVAAPMIAQAAAQATKPQVFSEWIVGEAVSFEPIQPAFATAPDARSEVIRRLNAGVMTRDEVRAREDMPPDYDADPAVAAQMLDHDLFEPSSTRSPAQ